MNRQRAHAHKLLFFTQIHGWLANDKRSTRLISVAVYWLLCCLKIKTMSKKRKKEMLRGFI